MSTTTASGAILTNSINAITADTGDISIGALQTDGDLNLGAGTARTASGAINIGNTASLNTIKIDTASVLNALATPAIAIGTSASKKTICIGNNTAVSNNTVFLGNCEVVTSSGGVEINNGNSTMYLGNKQTSAVLNVGTQAGITRGSSATVNIANQSSNTCAVNVMCGGATVGGSVNIANQGANSTVINIGSTTGTGTMALQTTGIINFGSAQTANALNIGCNGDESVTGRTSGNINIGTDSGMTGVIKIGNFNTITDVQCRGKLTVSRAFLTTALFTAASAQINANCNVDGNLTANAATATVTLKAGTGTLGTPIGGAVNIATATGATFVTTAVNIGTGDTTGTVTLGNTGNTVQVNGGLTIGTGKNITLQATAGYVVPTADTMLGGITIGTFLTPASSFSANKNIATMDLVKATYMVFFNITANYTTLPTVNWIDLDGTAVGAPLVEIGATTLYAGTLGINGSFPISVTTAGTLILRYNITGTIDSIGFSSYRAVRIA